MLKKPKVKNLLTVKYKTSAIKNVKENSGQSYMEQTKQPCRYVMGLTLQLTGGLNITVSSKFNFK